jgi:hypothetical protein
LVFSKQRVSTKIECSVVSFAYRFTIINNELDCD